MTNIYKKSGVDIDAGNKFVDNIKTLVASTNRHGVLGGLGSFGGFFAPDLSDIKEPVLVSGTDGVGTKLKIAIDMGKLDTIGIDLVAMCVNDIVCSGAEPLFFLDYFATSKLLPDEHAKIIAGIAKACRQTKCALIGGETAEMPDLYAKNDFDLAGFAVGIVDKNKIIDGSEIKSGDAIIGVHSSGFHSNGYSLVRHIVKTANLDLHKTYEGFDKTLGELLLTPTILYSPLILSLRKTFHIKGIAHITGGGFWDNIPRILPNYIEASIKKDSWTIPPLFRFFQKYGEIDDRELLRVFNCGVGLVIVAAQNEVEDILDTINSHNMEAQIIGVTCQRRKDGPEITIL